jgi:hypothetical protein
MDAKVRIFETSLRDGHDKTGSNLSIFAALT